MGAEFQCEINKNEGEIIEESCGEGAAAPVVVGLQPAAVVDHVARVDLFLLSQIPGECGASFRVAAEELKHTLDKINASILPTPLKTIAGGSVANTIRGLAAGFDIRCGIIGAYGNDQQGDLFVDNMSFYKVDVSRLRVKNGHTAQIVVAERRSSTARRVESEESEGDIVKITFPAFNLRVNLKASWELDPFNPFWGKIVQYKYFTNSSGKTVELADQRLQVQTPHTNTFSVEHVPLNDLKIRSDI